MWRQRESPPYWRTIFWLSALALLWIGVIGGIVFEGPISRALCQSCREDELAEGAMPFLEVSFLVIGLLFAGWLFNKTRW